MFCVGELVIISLIGKSQNSAKAKITRYDLSATILSKLVGSLSNSQVASIQKNGGDRSHQVIEPKAINNSSTCSLLLLSLIMTTLFLARRIIIEHRSSQAL